MPRGDGTGPRGMGAMTGRAAGFCAGYGMPGYMNPTSGRGFGMGFGRGRGRGFGGGGAGRGWGMPYGAPAYGAAYAGVPGAPSGAPYAMPYAPAPTKEQEMEMLKGQAGQFEATLGDIRKRLQELETEQAEK